MIREKRQTKIIWSLDSQALDESLAKDIINRRSINALRFIYDPKRVDSILRFIPLVRTASAPRQASQLPIMIDVGAQPRGLVAKVREHQEFIYGEKICLAPQGQGGGDIELATEEWSTLFAVNEQIFFGYGNVIVKAVEYSDQQLIAKVVKGGSIQPGHEIHVPATRKDPSIFDLSYIDIKPFQRLGIDYVVLPGLSSAREISVARKKLNLDGEETPWLIIRVDNLKAVENLEDLLNEADGILISRRELALTVDPATIPMVCKEITRACNEKSKLVFIASEMLASMREHPTPTRAEVSDIANAVIDGTDAIVLSEDITKGKYHSKALALSESIITDVEEHTDVEVNWKKEALAICNEFDAVAYHAFRTAERVKAKAIVCITKQGNTALRLASFRTPMPIIAVTFTEKVKRKLALVRGVYSIVLDLAPHLDEVLPVVTDRLKRESWLSSGDRIVFVTVTLSPVGQEASNLFTIQRLD